VFNEEDEEVEVDVDENVLDDHINDEIIQNDIDDVLMPNPFSVDYKHDSEPNDIDLELDEEEDQ
jgi:hypothetical protein